MRYSCLSEHASARGDLPEEARTRLREILDVLGEPLTAERVAYAALRM